MSGPSPSGSRPVTVPLPAQHEIGGAGRGKLSRLTSHHRALLHGVSQNTLKQLKFVLPGGFVTYVLGTVARLAALLEAEAPGWARIYARTSLACAVLTVALFLYIMLVPWVKGVSPNYSQWRRSGDLSLVVPTLTALMVLGWPLLSYTLSHWTDLGFLKGIIASCGLYALVLGLLGLIPAPIAKRQ